MQKAYIVQLTGQYFRCKKGEKLNIENIRAVVIDFFLYKRIKKSKILISMRKLGYRLVCYITNIIQVCRVYPPLCGEEQAVSRAAPPTHIIMSIVIDGM